MKTRNFLKSQFILFGGVGIVSTAIDAIFYFLIIKFILADISIAKAISFIAGTSNSYFLNRTYTFKSNISHKKGMAKHFALYGFSLLINVFTNKTIFNLLEGSGENFAIEIAFLIATTFSVVINFLGLKFYVHKT
jgi:putative flippase GtrA